MSVDEKFNHLCDTVSISLFVSDLFDKVGVKTVDDIIYRIECEEGAVPFMKAICQSEYNLYSHTSGEWGYYYFRFAKDPAGKVGHKATHAHDLSQFRVFMRYLMDKLRLRLDKLVRSGQPKLITEYYRLEKAHYMRSHLNYDYNWSPEERKRYRRLVWPIIVDFEEFDTPPVALGGPKSALYLGNPMKKQKVEEIIDLTVDEV